MKTTPAIFARLDALYGHRRVAILMGGGASGKTLHAVLYAVGHTGSGFLDAGRLTASDLVVLAREVRAWEKRAGQGALLVVDDLHLCGPTLLDELDITLDGCLERRPDLRVLFTARDTGSSVRKRWRPRMREAYDRGRCAMRAQFDQFCAVFERVTRRGADLLSEDVVDRFDHDLHMFATALVLDPSGRPDPGLALGRMRDDLEAQSRFSPKFVDMLIVIATCSELEISVPTGPLGGRVTVMSTLGTSISEQLIQDERGGDHRVRFWHASRGRTYRQALERDLPDALRSIVNALPTLLPALGAASLRVDPRAQTCLREVLSQHRDEFVNAMLGSSPAEVVQILAAHGASLALDPQKVVLRVAASTPSHPAHRLAGRIHELSGLDKVRQGLANLWLTTALPLASADSDEVRALASAMIGISIGRTYTELLTINGLSPRHARAVCGAWLADPHALDRFVAAVSSSSIDDVHSFFLAVRQRCPELADQWLRSLLTQHATTLCDRAAANPTLLMKLLETADDVMIVPLPWSTWQGLAATFARLLLVDPTSLLERDHIQGGKGIAYLSEFDPEAEHRLCGALVAPELHHRVFAWQGANSTLPQLYRIAFRLRHADVDGARALGEYGLERCRDLPPHHIASWVAFARQCAPEALEAWRSAPSVRSQIPEWIYDLSRMPTNYLLVPFLLDAIIEPYERQACAARSLAFRCRHPLTADMIGGISRVCLHLQGRPPQRVRTALLGLDEAFREACTDNLLALFLMGAHRCLPFGVEFAWWDATRAYVRRRLATAPSGGRLHAPSSLVDRVKLLGAAALCWTANLPTRIDRPPLLQERRGWLRPKLYQQHGARSADLLLITLGASLLEDPDQDLRFDDLSESDMDHWARCIEEARPFFDHSDEGAEAVYRAAYFVEQRRPRTHRFSS